MTAEQGGVPNGSAHARTTMVTPTLAKLVADRKEAIGKSYREIAADAGVALSTIHKMAQGRMHQVPGPRIAEGVAYALGVNPQVLLDAVAHDLGVKEFRLEDADRTTVYHALGDLSPRQRRLVLEVVNEMREHSGLPPVGPDEAPPL